VGSHDTLFKFAIRIPSTALAILRAALPRELFAALDPETLEVSDGNFVNENLRERFADALLEVKSHGEPTLIYLLFEHKSRAERFTVLDLVDAVVRIWQTWRRNQEAADSLPRVIPIVFHHANVEWDQPKDLRELLAGDADLTRAFAKHDPSFPVVFFDLGGIDDPEAAIADIADPYAQCVIFILIVARLRTFIQQMKRRGYALLSATLRLPNGEALVRPVLEYVFETAPADIDPAEFVDVSAQ
jgi:Putative transposase, YhgA-like